MFLIREPDSRTLDRILARSALLQLSYSPVGIADHLAPAGFRVDETSGLIGHGRHAFARAVHGLQLWRQFDLGWVSIYPAGAPLVAGSNVLVIARHLGFCSVNACRVVYRLGVESPAAGSEPAGARKAGTVPELGDSPRKEIAGFAYGTLTGHAEAGEEIFAVSYDPGSEDVTYRIRAVSRESALIAKLGFPVARALQARFRRDSLLAMRRHVAETAR